MGTPCLWQRWSQDKCKVGMDVAASEFKVEGQDCYDLGTWYPDAETPGGIFGSSGLWLWKWGVPSYTPKRIWSFHDDDDDDDDDDDESTDFGTQPLIELATRMIFWDFLDRYVIDSVVERGKICFFILALKASFISPPGFHFCHVTYAFFSKPDALSTPDPPCTT